MAYDQAYVNRELQEAHRDEQGVNNAPLSERQENRKTFQEVIAEDPATAAERLSWIFDGNHGAGAMFKARQILAAKRMNRVAALTQLVAVFEYRCPANFAVDAWKKLSKAQQDNLKSAIEVVIKAAEKEIAEEE